MRTLKPGSNSFSFHAVLGQVGMIGFLLLVFYEGQGLSHAAFGALGLGVGLSNILFAIAAGLISVQEAFVSWAIGGDKKQVALDWFNPFLVVSFVCALILASVMILAPLCVHNFIHDQRMAKECIIIFPGLAIALLFQILFHCFRNYLQSAGLPQLTSTVLWLGNLFFLAIAQFYGPETDVDPTVRIVTLTICSRLFMLALIFVFSKAQLDISGFPNFRAKETAKYFALLKLGLPASAQTLLEGGLFFLIFVFAAQLDAKSLGLQSVVANLVNFIFAIPYGISASSSNEVGRALGRTRAMEAIRLEKVLLYTWYYDGAFVGVDHLWSGCSALRL